MTKQNYLTEIERATRAEILHALRTDAINDASLFQLDVDEVCEAVRARFGQLNAASAETAVRRGRWDLPRRARKTLTLIFLILAVVPGIAPAPIGLVIFNARPVSALKAGHPASAGRRELMLGRRLASLSMLESGDDDRAVGRAGEVSRFQILPPVWREYFPGWRKEANFAALCRRAATNPVTAWNVAAMIMEERGRAFEARWHRAPTDAEFYVLWARPACLLTQHPAAEIIHDGRALRFENLVKRFDANCAN